METPFDLIWSRPVGARPGPGVAKLVWESDTSLATYPQYDSPTHATYLPQPLTPVPAPPASAQLTNPFLTQAINYSAAPTFAVGASTGAPAQPCSTEHAYLTSPQLRFLQRPSDAVGRVVENSSPYGLTALPPAVMTAPPAVMTAPPAVMTAPPVAGRVPPPAPIDDGGAGYTVKVTLFSGELHESFPQWLEDYETVATSYGWPRDLQLQRLGLYLRGRARDIYRSMATPEGSDYATVREELLNAFTSGARNEAARSRLHKLRQGANQSVYDFYRTLRDVAAVAYPTMPLAERDRLTLSLFTNG